MIKILLLCAAVGLSISRGEFEEPDVYYIGDSRTVGLAEAIGLDEDYVIAAVGKGYNWVTSDEIASKVDAIETGSRVIVNLGVNDIYNVEKYVEYYQELEDKGLDVYYVSVNPVIDGYCNVTNAEIEEFNSYFEDEENYIDVYSQFEADWISGDGLHYTKEGYENIYEIIMEELNGKLY